MKRTDLKPPGPDLPKKVKNVRARVVRNKTAKKVEPSTESQSTEGVRPNWTQEAGGDEVKADWIFSSREELNPDQPLLDVPSDHTFAGLTIEELQNMPPLPKIPAPYRPDMLVDPPVHQMDLQAWQDFEAESTRDATRAELERLQIETVVGLVDNVGVEVGGAHLKRKLLFLSNKQARLLPFDNIDKIMSGLDFYPRPKLVIQLVSSTAAGLGQTLRSPLLEHHWTDCGLQSEDVNLTHYFVSETDGLNGLRQTEYKIQTFLTESLIPLARQHNALVIVSNSACSLSHAFGQLCAAEAERRKGNLGFYVLAFLEAPHLLLSCRNPDTVAFQLRRASKNWKKHDDEMWYVMKKTKGDESMFYNHYMDAPNGCTHYIVADCISNDENGLKRDWSPLHVLRSRLIQAMLSSQIPGFGVATLQLQWGYRGLHNFADHVARGIPLLLLDSRDPPRRPIQSVEDVILHLSELDHELAEQGTGNFYNTSTLAFLHQTLLGLLQRSHIHRTRLGSVAGIGKHVQDRVAKDNRIPLWRQVETFEEEMFLNDISLDSAEDNTSILYQDAPRSLAESLVEGFLTMMCDKTTLAQPNWDVSELPKDRFKDILLRTVGELLRCNSKQKLDEFLEHYSLRCLSSEHLQKVTSFRNAPFSVKHGMKGGTLFKRILQVAPEADWKDAKQYIFSCLKDDCLTFDGKFRRRSHLPHSPEIKGVFLQILGSPLTHSANLMDLARIEKVLMLVNVDRRVPKVGLTSCQVLQRAWADVDVYHHVASQMKWVAKISYAVMLLTGYAITVLTVINMNVPDTMPEATTNYIVLGLSVSVGVTSALMAFLDPTTKWQQLRAAALTLEAEIWKFRSSAGVYKRDMMSDYVESAEEALSQFVSVTEDSVLKSAGISESAFLSTFSFSRAPTSVRIYKHGQYQGAAWKGAAQSNDAGIVDDHYSPLTSREYLALRFQSHVQFYQRRLPIYARQHTLHQIGAAFASALLTILVFFGESRWCALCTAGVAAATAWTEFTSMKRKMRRYSETVHQAHQVLLWWQSLQRMQQTTNFTVLVERCEACFATEYSTWVSSMSTHRDGQRKVGQDLLQIDDTGEQLQNKRLQKDKPDKPRFVRQSTK